MGGGETSALAMDFGADAAVVAYRQSPIGIPLSQLQPKVTTNGGAVETSLLWDGDLNHDVRFEASASGQKSWIQFDFTKPRSFHAGASTWIDLGKVANLAEVTLNGKPLGLAWKSPYRVDATAVLHPRDNLLQIRVVNLWVNRLIGD